MLAERESRLSSVTPGCLEVCDAFPWRTRAVRQQLQARRAVWSVTGDGDICAENLRSTKRNCSENASSIDCFIAGGVFRLCSLSLLFPKPSIDEPALDSWRGSVSEPLSYHYGAPSGITGKQARMLCLLLTVPLSCLIPWFLVQFGAWSKRLTQSVHSALASASSSLPPLHSLKRSSTSRAVPVLGPPIGGNQLHIGT
ncbi:unnamed protein product [Pleuronectes platessa]|uniref:Uncharacterized protein n=1 Tax=Pleuronectes platessa TaxID=8262 RepID=A0A9N7V173_PLEPL|nr:unnamed protein product [Pleuronectes platessa]